MTYSELLNLVHVHSFTLCAEGLTISYTLGKATKHLIAEPERAADLLAQIGYIDRYEVTAGRPSIVLYFTEAPLSWASFVAGARFSQHAAIQAAVRHEMNRADEATLRLFQ